MHTWQHLDDWLSKHAPDAFPSLNPPATPEAIAQVERHIGLAFPPSLRASFLAHDGEAEDSAGLFDYWQLLPLNRVVEQWDEHALIEAEYGSARFGDGEFSTKRAIPVMWFEGEICYVEGSKESVEGVMFELLRHGKPRRIAETFGAFLGEQYRRLVSGELIVEPDFGYNLVPKGRSISGA